MIEQNTALWIFSVLAAIYIFWIDAKPLIMEYFKREYLRALAIDVFAVKIQVNGEHFWENQFYLHILNCQKGSGTVFNMRALVLTAFSEHTASFRGDLAQVDLHGGEAARILIGASVTRDLIYRPEFESLLSSDITEVLVKNDLEHNHKILLSGNVNFVAVMGGKVHDHPDHYLTVRVLANDIPPQSFNCGLAVREGEADMFVIDTRALEFQPGKLLSRITKKQQ